MSWIKKIFFPQASTKDESEHVDHQSGSPKRSSKRYRFKDSVGFHTFLAMYGRHFDSVRNEVLIRKAKKKYIALDTYDKKLFHQLGYENPSLYQATKSKVRTTKNAKNTAKPKKTICEMKASLKSRSALGKQDVKGQRVSGKPKKANERPIKKNVKPERKNPLDPLKPNDESFVSNNFSPSRKVNYKNSSVIVNSTDYMNHNVLNISSALRKTNYGPQSGAKKNPSYYRTPHRLVSNVSTVMGKANYKHRSSKDKPSDWLNPLEQYASNTISSSRQANHRNRTRNLSPEERKAHRQNFYKNEMGRRF